MRGTTSLVMVVLSAVIPGILSCGHENSLAAGPPPGASEPIFEAATNVSLFFDGFESYANTASLTSGSGAVTYVTGSLGLSGISVVSGGAGEGAKKTQFDYQGSGEIDRLLETYSVQDPESGRGSVVVATWLMRQNGGRTYEGKTFITFPSSGAPRFLYHISQSISYPTDLRRCWWDDDMNPITSGPPAGYAPVPTWNRDDTSLPGGIGYSYKQNMAGSTYRWQDRARDGNWHRLTARFTQGSPHGRGRLEMWADGVKIMEYIGDDPGRCEYGKVYVPTQSSVITGFQWPGPSAFNWPGGATVEFDAIRIWTP